MKSKRGLDAVVTTLIIVLLAIVAIGIVWVVVRNVLSSSSQQLSLNQECLAVQMQVKNVVAVPGQPGNYTVTLMRESTGSSLNQTVGVKVSMSNSTASGPTTDFGGGYQFNELDTHAATVVGVTGANELSFTAYFTSSAGTQQLCSQTGTYPF